MKKFAVLVAVTVLAIVATSAFAQELTIKPRGSVTTTPAVTTPAPASTAAPTATPAVATPTTVAPDGSEVVALGKQLRKEMQTELDQDWKVKSKDLAKITEVADKSVARLGFELLLVEITILVLIVAVILMWWRGRRATHAPATHRGTHVVAPVILFLLGLGLAANAQAQTPATAKPTAKCTITAISKGAVVVKEQEPAAISIAVKGCTEVTSIVVATLANDITFTDVQQKGNIVTAKVAATATAATGPTAIKVVLADGIDAVSPDSTYILILDMAAAAIRNEATKANAKVTASVTAVTKDVTSVKTEVKNLGTQITAISSATYTKREVDALVANLKKQMAELETLATATAKAEAVTAQKQNISAGNIELLRQAMIALTVGQETLAGTEVKKGVFSGKKPLDADVAATAEKIRKDLQTAIIK